MRRMAPYFGVFAYLVCIQGVSTCAYLWICAGGYNAVDGPKDKSDCVFLFFAEALISFDVPYPPDYGGVIDVYYKLEALKNIGIRVHPGGFTHGRPPSRILQYLCRTVHYYPSKTGLVSNLFLTPCIVQSRKLIVAGSNPPEALVNKDMVQGTGLKALCLAGNDAEALRGHIEKTFTRDFKTVEIENRKDLLLKNHSNTLNAEKLSQYIFKQA